MCVYANKSSRKLQICASLRWILIAENSVFWNQISATALKNFLELKEEIIKIICQVDLLFWVERLAYLASLPSDVFEF